MHYRVYYLIGNVEKFKDFALWGHGVEPFINSGINWTRIIDLDSNFVL